MNQYNGTMKDDMAGCLKEVVIRLGVMLVMAIVLWLSWNFVVPDVFGIKSITFIQACVILLLSNILFKHTAWPSRKDNA